MDFSLEKANSSVFCKEPGKVIYFLPSFALILLCFGFTTIGFHGNETLVEIHSKDNNNKQYDFSALVLPEIFSKNLRDTIYTTDDLWLEFRIDQQMLYVHFRDGKVVKYPVSSGIPGAHKSVDSRPGLFAIFHKAEVHKSSQFNSQLNYFMPFNMGIGFHGLQGTGYYAHLGVRPSSHGCVRMRNEDVRELFKICKIGTLVLAHKGKTARVIAFAPEGFSNEREYSEQDYIHMLAYNLAAIMEGRYLINPPKRFIIDGKIIPKIGINIGSSDNIPEKQILPIEIPVTEISSDRLRQNADYDLLKKAPDYSINFGEDNDFAMKSDLDITASPEMIRKYYHNPLGILPYFPPDR